MVHPPSAVSVRPSTGVVETLMRTEWETREAAYGRRVERVLMPHTERTGRGEAHPIEDFLFTYYRWRPAQLRRWHPGAGVVLRGAADTARARWSYYRSTGGDVSVDVEELLGRRKTWFVDTVRILAATADRPAAFGCFGMHEWAMLYHRPKSDYRHATWPLRLSPDRVDAAVEDRRLVCTHFDAFRFFTPAAAPRNTTQLTRPGQSAAEQPGCLHAGMDLYKYAYRLSPYVASDLVLDCFELAREIRLVDMRATPYDFSALGVDPIEVEHAAGRAEYVEAQQRFARLAAPLRRRLVETGRAALDETEAP